MGRSLRLARHLSEVAMVLGLMVVYVVALSVGTVFRTIKNWLSSVGSSPMGTEQRQHDSPS